VRRDGRVEREEQAIVPARPPRRRVRQARPPLRHRVAHESRRGRAVPELLEAEHEVVAQVLNDDMPDREGGRRSRACWGLPRPARPVGNKLLLYFIQFYDFFVWTDYFSVWVGP
jgi:hypothetical protein